MDTLGMTDNIEYMIWLHKMGFHETHEILYIVMDVVLKHIDNEQKGIPKWFKKLNYEIDHRTWLYKIGLIETHGVLYFLEYGSWFRKNGYNNSNNHYT